MLSYLESNLTYRYISGMTPKSRMFLYVVEKQRDKKTRWKKIYETCNKDIIMPVTSEYLGLGFSIPTFTVDPANNNVF